MVKQLFAGQLGLTLLCTMFLAWPCGRPLDLQYGWDADSRAGIAQVQMELQTEDPYCTVLSHPCGPWSKWSVINISKGGAARDTVLQARENSRGLLKQVNRIVTGRVAAGRHVLLEHPADSLSWSQPEMAGIAKLLQEEKLYYIRCDGCALGYHDHDSGLPHKKPVGIITSMVSALSVFANLKCPGCAEHQRLEGSNSRGMRTTQAAEWPPMLDKLVADTIAQQALIDECAEEAFPAEVRPGGPLPLRPFRRRRLNRDWPSAEDGRPADPAPPPEGAEDEPPEPPQAPP